VVLPERRSRSSRNSKASAGRRTRRFGVGRLSTRRASNLTHESQPKADIPGLPSWRGQRNRSIPEGHVDLRPPRWRVQAFPASKLNRAAAIPEASGRSSVDLGLANPFRSQPGWPAMTGERAALHPAALARIAVTPRSSQLASPGRVPRLAVVPRSLATGPQGTSGRFSALVTHLLYFPTLRIPIAAPGSMAENLAHFRHPDAFCAVVGGPCPLSEACLAPRPAPARPQFAARPKR